MTSVFVIVTLCLTLVVGGVGKKMPEVKAFFQGHCGLLSPCHQLCHDLPLGGFECSCSDGFLLQPNGFSCTAHHPTTLKDEESDRVSKTFQNALKDYEDEIIPSFISKEDSGKNVTKQFEKHKLNAESVSMMSGFEEAEKYFTSKASEKQQRADKMQRKVKRAKDRQKSKSNSKEEVFHEHHLEGIASNGTEHKLFRPNSQTAAGTVTCELQCAAGGRCYRDPSTNTARCQCLLGTSGSYCEQDLVVKYPRFNGLAYITFPVLRGAHKEFLIILEFRPEMQTGLILFSADRQNARFDFFSISLSNGFVEFRFDCGSGAALLRTSSSVNLHKWNHLSVHRNEWNAWIRLNNGSQVHGRSKGKFSHINFQEDLYLGGYTNMSRIVDRVGISEGFSGCIRFLQINERPYDMRKGAFIGDAIGGLDIEDCSANVCNHVKCLNSGSCSANGADSMTCLCPLGTAGSHCESRINIQVPMFNSDSYLQFIGLHRNVLSYTEIEMVVKPTDKNGLIFYNGYSKDRTGDFISLALRNGYVEYRFDLGTGSAFIRSPHAISMNEWHVIWFERTGRVGTLKVDNQPYVEGMASGAFTQLTLTLDLFIGGHKNFDEVAKAAHVTNSFQGCIQKVTINKRPMKLLEELISGVNIANCDHPCIGQPCSNGGRCIPNNDRYRCNCPLDYSDTNCEHHEVDRNSITVPAFFGDSYLFYLGPFFAQRTRGKKIDVQMRIKTRHPDGLLFWVSEEESSSPYSDFLALGIKNGHAQFSYNLGSGEVRIVNNQTRISDDRWHTIRIQRNERKGYLEVDGMEPVEGTSPGNMKQLSTSGTIFIGGMDDIVHGTLYRYSTGFIGCISNVTVATDSPINLMVEADDGTNIAQCDNRIFDEDKTNLWL